MINQSFDMGGGHSPRRKYICILLLRNNEIIINLCHIFFSLICKRILCCYGTSVCVCVLYQSLMCKCQIMHLLWQLRIGTHLCHIWITSKSPILKILRQYILSYQSHVGKLALFVLLWHLLLKLYQNLIFVIHVSRNPRWRPHEPHGTFFMMETFVFPIMDCLDTFRNLKKVCFAE